MENLSNEILFKIFEYNCFSAEDLLALGSVSCRFYDICQDERLWKTRFQRRWPRIWKKMDSYYLKYNGSIKFKMETINVLSSRQKLGKILEKINPDCHKRRRVNLEILSSVLDLLNFGTYNPLYILNELFVIVYDKSDVDSTFKNHVEQILYHVHTVICVNELEKFLNNEPERQTFERGTFHFGQCFNHENFFKIDYQDISSKIDALAHEVQSYLMERNADHPAVSMELLSPDEPLRETRWTEAQSLDLFDCINYVIFEKYNFRQTFQVNLFTLHHLVICERLETEKGGNFIPVLVYMFVCHRLGIFLELELLDYLSLRWTVPK